MICDYTLQQIGHQAEPEVNDPHRQWKDWIFDESIKRYSPLITELFSMVHIR